MAPPDLAQRVHARVAPGVDRGKPIDGHAPGLRGPDAKAYFAAGISTDHECFTKEEAQEKLGYGAKIMIREGSAARNFDALCSLIDDHAESCMFSSDDKHPDELLAGHVNLLVKRAVAWGSMSLVELMQELVKGQSDLSFIYELLGVREG